MGHGPDQRAVEDIGAFDSPESATSRRTRPTLAGQPGRPQRHFVGAPNRSPVERPSRSIPTVPDLPSAIPAMGQEGRDEGGPSGLGRGSLRERRPRPQRSLHRRILLGSQKRGLRVGKTKRGKGCKIMAIADGNGLPIAACVTSASPHEVTLVEETLQETFVLEPPERLIGDKAYDSDPLAERLSTEYDIELIAPNRSNRKVRTQDGRSLRRYSRRWKVERLFAWLHNFRRLVTRYEYHADNFQGMVHLACIIILLRYL